MVFSLKTSLKICHAGFVLCLLQWFPFYLFLMFSVRLIQWVRRLLGWPPFVYRSNYRFAHYAHNLAFYLCDVHFHRKFPPGFDINTEPSLLLMNHNSYLDAILGWLVFPDPIFFLAKKELWKNPVVALILEDSGTIPVDRSVHADGVKSIDTAVTRLREGRHVCIMPEGTRNPDSHLRKGEMLPLKMGAFHCAKQAPARIVVMFCDGNSRLWRKGTNLPMPGHIYITVGETIGRGEVESTEVHALRDKTKEVFEKIRECRPDEQIYKEPNPWPALLYILASCVFYWWLIRKIF